MKGVDLEDVTGSIGLGVISPQCGHFTHWENAIQIS